MPGKITTGGVAKALRAARERGQRMVLRDGEVGGLSMRCGGRGGVWSYEYRMQGRDPEGRRHPTQHHRIGTAQSHSPDEARAAAAQIKAQLIDGKDPRVERERTRRRATEEVRGLMLVRDAVERYARERLPFLRGGGRQKPRSVAMSRWYLDHAVAGCAGKPVGSVERADVIAMLDVQSGSQSNARQCLGYLTRFLDWCMEVGVAETNVARDLPRQRRPASPQARQHVPSLDEVARIWRASEALPASRRAYVRLLIATALRREEVKSLDRHWIDGDTITLPGLTMKNGEPFRVPIGPLAHEIIAGLPTKGRLFPERWSMSDMKAKLDKASGVTGWRLHDLRRAFASHLAEARIPADVIDASLAHRRSATRGGVLGVYNASSLWPQRGEAMERWHQLLKAAIKSKGAEVVRVA